MLKQFIGIIFSLFVGVAVADVGPVANIEWVHGAINNIWGVEIPYHADLKNPLYASNMEYLLTAVDRANYVINGFESTQYRKDSKYATKLAANIETADAAINNLIREEVLVFRTLRTTTSFSIQIAAKGNFTIDWGDGNVQEINQTTVNQTTYSHNYDKAGVYYIRPRGTATEYNANGFVPSIKIGTPTALATINGSLGSVFPTLSNGSQPSFYGTFAGCTNLRGKIPENLFEGVYGQADKSYIFATLFDGCTKLEGPIPENLFSSITGTPVQGMFESTFRNCSSLKGSIPEKLFQSVAGDMPNYMFNMTFWGCSSLTGSIPGDLFRTITGQPGIAGFYRLFNGTGLTGSIPGTLFQNLNGESQESSFAETFASTKLSGRIPEDLFKGVTGRPGVSAFWATFGSSRSLSGPIPEKLFASMSGAPRANSFRSTFNRTGTCGNLPAGLFATIQGEPAEAVFYETFVDCGVNRIPEGLFSGIKGPPAPYMFYRTFHWNGLGSIPAGLFSGIKGPPAPYMFYGTFDSTSGTGTIGAPLFGDLRGTAANQMFYGTFNKSGGTLTGPSAQMQIVNEDGTIENHFIYEFWDMTSNQSTYNSRASGMDDYACIPTTWGGGGTKDVPACFSDWPFSVTVTGTGFGFNITAAGKFWVDWGDGTYETIENLIASSKTVSHTFSDTAEKHVVRLRGAPTDYLADTSVITFASATQITEISGSIGRVFPTLVGGKNPVFAALFENANLMTCEIPEDLFDGIVGQPVPYMFAYTFSNCPGLTGTIPEGLFAGLDGTPVESLFEGTFAQTWGLSGEVPSGLFAGIKGAPAPYMFAMTFVESYIDDIPGDLFAGIQGAPAEGMFVWTFKDAGPSSLPEGLFAGIKGAPAPSMFYGTFYNNTEISGEIPLGFFGDISGPGADAMFQETFIGCGGLTGYSARDKNGEFLYNIWPEEEFGRDCYSPYYQTPKKLTDWDCIPESWGGPATGDSAKCIGDWPLTMTVQGDSFAMDFAFEGQAFVDWGDGTYETYDGLVSADHTYSSAGTYNVRLAARPTAYYDSSYSTVRITEPSALVGIQGSLGEVFPTLADGSNPVFANAFEETRNLTTIPETLFSGISGTATPYMFYQTFIGSGLTELPTYLFAGITTPAESMFESTFDSCTALTAIPENLFLDLQLGQTPPTNMFKYMFAGCTELHGESAKINGMYLYDEFANVADVFDGMYLDCSGLTDYASIPTSWKSQ